MTTVTMADPDVMSRPEVALLEPMVDAIDREQWLACTRDTTTAAVRQVGFVVQRALGDSSVRQGRGPCLRVPNEYEVVSIRVVSSDRTVYLRGDSRRFQPMPRGRDVCLYSGVVVEDLQSSGEIPV